MKTEYKSRVYTDRPAYADFDPAAKFQTIQSIIAKHLKAHPKAMGGQINMFEDEKC